MVKRVLLQIALVPLGVAFVLLMLEVGLRLAGHPPDFLYQLDPNVGAVHIPNKKAWVTVQGREPNLVEINSHGYRDYERAVAKPPDTVRIAVLGDSFVEAVEVAFDETFVQLLEKRLNRSCGDGVTFEVLNFGVSGFGTGQALETLRGRVLEFEPDLVLLFMYPSNDIFDDSRELDLEPNRLHFALEADGTLRRLPYEVRDNAVKQWLRHHSSAYLFIRDRVKSLTALRRALTSLELVQETAVGGRTDHREAFRSLRDSRYATPLSPALERAWKISEALVAEVARESTEHGAEFAAVVIPNREEVLDREEEYSLDPARADFQQSLAKIDGICARHSLRCLQLVDPIRNAGRPFFDLYLEGDGHFTPAGHALVAEQTAAFVEPWVCGATGAGGGRTAATR